MPSAMFIANTLFLSTLAAVAGLFVYGIARAGRTLGEPTAHTARWTIGAASGLALWLALSGLLAANTIISELPFVWLPTVLVQAALLGHLLIFRRLWRELRRRMPADRRRTAV